MFFDFDFRTFKFSRNRSGEDNDAESRKRLIAVPEDSDHSSEDEMPPPGRSKSPSLTKSFIALTCSLTITNIITLSLWISTLHHTRSWLLSDCYNRPTFEYLGQAQAPVEYENRRFHTGIEKGDVTEFFGPPGTKADIAWNRILDTGLIRLTPEQASRLGESTAREWNTTDSVVSDTLYSSQIASSMHCIEYLRQIIMCLGDVTIEPVGFNETTLAYIAEKDQVRQCRKFDTVYDWAKLEANAIPDAPGNRKALEDMLKFKESHPIGHSHGGS
ncbi:hypothetical protein GGR50DRAFT_692712 [Xylaria sp. CBS 124048]|nr:hypothetical protein GGR50DRAFT_692712 [Xylaria sp. CBS 124048]